jgi:competence protein ComEA
MRRSILSRTTLLLSLTVGLWAQPQLPDGPGKEETAKLCTQCHELARSLAPRQDRDGWQATITKMVGLGMKGTDQEIATVTDFLAHNYPAPDVPPLNVNTATAIQLESRLTLRRSQAAAMIAYREKNGNFKSMEDLKKIPGIDPEKFESKKDHIVF